jgi:membrane protein
MMFRRQSDGADWLLVAGAAAAMLLVQRYLQDDPSPQEAAPLATGGPVLASSAPEYGADSNATGGISPVKLSSTSWADWKDILWRTYQHATENRLLANAAGVVFYGLLAIFPAITALVSCYGLFADPATISANLQSLALMLPDGSFQIVQDQITRVLAKGNTTLGFTFLFGLAFALWSANAGVKAVIDALNVAYEERETRSFIRLNLLSLTFTSGGMVALLMMISAVVAFPLALDHLGLAPDGELIISLARWPLLLGMLLVALGVLYRFGPSRHDARQSWLSIGAVVAAFLWLAGSSLLSWYLSNFANYGATYGSLGTAIGLMTWMWMSTIIVLYGGELNSEIEHRAASTPSSRVAQAAPAFGQGGRIRSIGSRDALAPPV